MHVERCESLFNLYIKNIDERSSNSTSVYTSRSPVYAFPRPLSVMIP
jgi:hypothetical protein